MKKLTVVRRNNIDHNGKYTVILELSNLSLNTVLPETQITCNPASGRSPYLAELFVLVFLFLQSISPSMLLRWRRTYPYRITCQKSQYGSHHYFVEEEKTKDFPRKRFTIHMSSQGKINEKVTMNLRDFLDLAVASTYLSINDRGSYALSERGSEIISSMEYFFIEPRDTSKEVGWTKETDSPTSIAWL